MPTGLFDIADRAEVLQPNEAEATLALMKTGMEFSGPRIDLVGARTRLIERWNRLVATANLIDAIRGQQ